MLRHLVQSLTIFIPYFFRCFSASPGNWCALSGSWSFESVLAVVHPVILVHFLYLECTLYVFLISNYTLYVRLRIALGVYRVRYVNIPSHMEYTGTL